MKQKMKQEQRWGVVLVNLGTPVRPESGAVRSFLREFLSDRRVVEIPRLIWWPILYGIILPWRPARVAKLYQQVWQSEGSPLKVITERQVGALQALFDQREGEAAPSICYAMTYGAPKLKDQVARLQEQGVERIVVLPLYPQYSATTTAAVYDQYAELLRLRNVPNIQFNKDYSWRADYIAALAQSVRDYWQEHGRGQRLLLSFHGIPKRCVDLGDPYYEQCVATANDLAKALGLAGDEWALSFQSRLGKAEWLKPYTDKLLQQWGQQGVESVDVICPAFAADCLETLEEINGENRQLFLESGGKSFAYIPCLNDSSAHIEMMAAIISEYR